MRPVALITPLAWLMAGGAHLLAQAEPAPRGGPTHDLLRAAVVRGYAEHCHRLGS